MNTKEMAQEQISAFADGEISEAQISGVLAALRQPAAKTDWEIYHHIGDVLRSDDMSLAMSPNFSARMVAALEKEPAIIVPHAQGERARASTNAVAPVGGMLPREPRRWALPGMVAAAAVAAVAFITTPQLMVAMKSTPAASSVAPQAAAAVADGAISVHASASAGQSVVVLRDPRIEDYLLAHQRFSPSVYSTAQYARSATFENNSNK